MKVKSLIVLAFFALVFSACSRSEPPVAVVTPPVIVPGNIVMNEIYAMGTTTDPDWIELYNPNSTAVNIGGYKIYDIGGQSGTKAKKEIPAGTTIPAKGFYVVVTDGTGSTDFGLSSAGEDVWLENASGTVIDNIKFLVHTAQQSCSRLPDGTGAWQVTSTITRGTSNK